MSEQAPGLEAAIAFYNAEQALSAATDLLKPFAQQQIEITKHVVEELGLRDNHQYRGFFRFDWIEIESGSFYEGDSSIPVINCELWSRGRCGGSDEVEAEMRLNKHILAGDPIKFEIELRGRLDEQAQKIKDIARQQTQAKIARLQDEIDNLKGKL